MNVRCVNFLKCVNNTIVNLICLCLKTDFCFVLQKFIELGTIIIISPKLNHDAVCSACSLVLLQITIQAFQAKLEIV